MKKQFIYLLCLFCGLLSFSLSVEAKEFSVPAKHAIAVEVTTGKILYEKDADTPAEIASITKLLTTYLIYEAIEEGKISLDSQVEISDYPYKLTTTDVSNVLLDARSYSVRDLLNASLITSANSAAIALAEKIAGSEPAFVDMMKAKLEEWGIKNAKLVNATGLNNSYLDKNIYPGSSSKDENQMSAAALAYIARRLILDYPQVLEITSQYSYNFAGTTYTSTNQMLREGTYARAGVDGLKTGTTDLSGASFVATTKQNQMRIVTVVLDADDGEEFPDNRFSATNDLMEYVYQTFSLITLVEKGTPYEASSVEVFNGQTGKSKAVAAQDLNAVIRKGSVSTVDAKFTRKEKILDAPIKKSKLLGKLTLKDEDLIGKGYLDQNPSVDMVAAKSISTAPWPISWWNHFIRYVNENL